MAKEGKISSRPIRFFRAIWINVLESGEIELPKAFVKMQGKDLPKHAYFKVRTGEVTKMGLRMCEDRAWLHKGWPEFVDKYSIQCGYFLNFQYHGQSRFDVVIFNMRCTEIKYPMISSTIRQKHQVCEDDSDDQVSEERPSKIQKGQGKMKNAKQSTQGKLSSVDARKRVLGKGNSLHSPNPHFMITMKPTYVSGKAYLYVPVAPAKSYFPSSGDGRMRVRLNGKTWRMEYNVTTSPRSVKIRVGWNEFANGNGLKAGDVCAFELVNRKPMKFDITIFQIGEEEEQQQEEEEYVKPRTPARNGLRRSKVMKRLLKSVKSFKSNNPNFAIHMNSTYIRRASVHIPSLHAKKYLNYDEHGENAITVYGPNGRRPWKMHYYQRLRFPNSRAKKVLLTDGWMDFVRRNLLAEGDVVIFERMSGKAKAYKVHIFRLKDHKRNKRAD